MSRKRVGQLGFADGLVAVSVPARRDRLLEISSLLDWDPFERVLNEIHASRRGEPSYPPLLMFKVLLLQRWYGLSDPGMEEALYDRLSFRRFVGLALADATPDHSTIFRFREQVVRRGLMAPLGDELQRQLDAGGAIVKAGTLIDATIVQGAARRPRKSEGRTSKVDPDARFGTNNERGRFAFGYKLHVGMDAGTGLVRSLVTTPANVQEVTQAERLIRGDEEAVYADRGYDARWLRRTLAEAGIDDGILRRGHRNRQITPEEVERNHALSLKRRPVEKFFGTLKRSYGLRRLPYFNLPRNAAALALACFAYNLRRWHAITTG